MSDPAWWQTAVIYQIYPRSFCDANGDGIGDLAGVIQKLDYLADTLGVDALWLSPFYPSPMADFGYDVADYMNVASEYGTLDAFDRLVEAAHARDLRVIIDFVPNHTSDQHPWFEAARSSREHPKRDWYVWADPKPDGSPPNNWLSMFGGPAWTWDEATQQYYLHTFLKEQPDLNWRNPAVRDAMFGVLQFWLERGVDGFRIDVAHFIMKDPAMRDNPPRATSDTAYHKSRGAYDTQLHLYDHGHPDVHDVYRQIRSLLDARGDRVAIGELHIYDWASWTAFYGEALDEMHLPFNFALLNAEWSADGVERVVNSLEAALPEGAWPNYVLGNHDEARLATRLGPAHTRLAAVLLLTLRGTPTLYYGDELGLPEADIPPERQKDPWGKNVPGLGRDGCRTPMPWTDAPAAGFSEAAPDALWLPIGDGHRALAVDEQLDDPGSVLNLYRRLLALRRTTPALQHGRYVPVNQRPDDCFVFIRAHDEAVYLVALNFSDAERTMVLPSGRHRGTIACATDPARDGTAVELYLTLGPHEGVVVEM
ncbi:alpha-amylase family glycosyl hydrolase [Salisaeta longa]|uniref:alpha-amylase family glycosyl hydrolase n=1 Tax=Salisaeta longa TaxID=503170 RepID=UPI0003B4D62B|nr:alpha-amylase family glycosyl hydrolase [Salisaeta longa]